MKKAISLFLCCAVLLACSFGLSGCIYMPLYTGEYKELYTVAVYSLPDAEGYMDHGEGAYDSAIYVWEQDDYGRTIFTYCEDVGHKIYALVVSQAYDDTNVYFYPDANYVTAIIDTGYRREGETYEDYIRNNTEALYLEHKDKLKEANDWNKPLDISRCVSYPITNRKKLGKTYSLSGVECNKILNEYSATLNLPNPDEYPHYSHRVLQADAEGKVLHQIWGFHNYYDNPNWEKGDPDITYNICLWVITDKDGNYDRENGVMVMYSEAEGTQRFAYNSDYVFEFKRRNNWTYAYCGE